MTCHQLVSVTAFCIDWCGVTIHTHQVVSQTTTITLLNRYAHVGEYIRENLLHERT